VLGCLLIAVAPANAFWLALVGWAVIGVAAAAHLAGGRATMQTVVRSEMQARFFSVNQSVNRVMVPLALALTGPLVDLWGVRPLWYVGAAIILAIALVRRFVPAVYYIEDRPDVGHSAEERVPEKRDDLDTARSSSTAKMMDSQ
jgi:DHA3 family macrolide efflux protein-like MFS transporter